jgi:hypothetical protein
MLVSLPMAITRRSFFKGLGAVSVGLLFRRQLDAVLASLESDLVDEPVGPNQRPSAAEIIIVPQTSFRAERLVVASAIAASFVIENISIGGRPQFVSNNELPAEQFTTFAMDSAIRLEAATAGTEIRFRVRYVGSNPAGAPFLAALIGGSLDSLGHQQLQILPINSGCAIAA